MTNHWAPISPCGPGCLSLPGVQPRAGVHRVALRLAAATGLMLLGAALAVVFALLWRSARNQLARMWFRTLLRAFGIRFVVRGGPAPQAGSLVVGNHVSWLDVIAMMAVCPMRVLAKTEVRSWPVIGLLAGRVGTLYIDRERLTALPEAVRTIADALRGGAVVGAFPEGTTWCGMAAGTYRPAVFQAAVDAGVAVQPMALRFTTRSGAIATSAAFVGEDTLLKSVLAVAREPELVVELTVLPEIDAAAVGDRREIARRAQRAVAGVTGLGGAHLPSSPEQQVAAA